jgi:hypothetical protein
VKRFWKYFPIPWFVIIVGGCVPMTRSQNQTTYTCPPGMELFNQGGQMVCRGVVANQKSNKDCPAGTIPKQVSAGGVSCDPDPNYNPNVGVNSGTVILQQEVCNGPKIPIGNGRWKCM